MRKHFDEGRNLAEKYGNIMDKIGKMSSTPKTQAETGGQSTTSGYNF